MQISKCNYPTLHKRFREILEDQHLVQLVEEPTRKKAILDLITTSYPAKISQVDEIPGISDHDILTVDIYITPIR